MYNHSLKMLLLFLMACTPLKAMENTFYSSSEETDFFEDWQLIPNQEEPVFTSKPTLPLREAALLFYTKLGDLAGLQLLFSSHHLISVDTQDPRTGDTALHLAVKKGNEHAITTLLQHKAGLRSNNHGNTPVHSAILARQTLPLINLLLTHPDIKLYCNIKNKGELTPLFLALKRLKHACCPNKKKTKHKDTIQDKDTIKALIFRLLEVGDKTQVNIASKQKMPITIALKTKEQEVIKALIALGATAQDPYTSYIQLKEESSKQPSFFSEVRGKIEELFTFIA